MSFPQNQQTPEEQAAAFGAPGVPQQQASMVPQLDPSQQQGQFPGPTQAQGPGSAGPSPGGDQKTTLWYVRIGKGSGMTRETANDVQDG